MAVGIKPISGPWNSSKAIAAFSLALITSVATSTSASATARHPDVTPRSQSAQSEPAFASGSEYICTPSGFGRKAKCSLRT